MTELKDSRFTELLPSDLKNDAETQAFAYAVSRQVQQIIRFADAACIYIAIDSVPEPVLDLLAVELRTPVYKQTYSVATKRALVKESLIFYDQMGTPAAVNRIIEAVFGEGYIQEWWEYNGQPHHFRAVVSGNRPSASAIKEFRETVKAVKRLSSWLDSITYSMGSKVTAYASSAFCSSRTSFCVCIPGTIQPRAVRATAYAIGAATSARTVEEVSIPGTITRNTIGGQTT